MYAFFMIFVVFYSLIIPRFQTTIKPTLCKLGSNKIAMPNRLIESWLLITATLFPLTSVVKARESGYDLKESLSFLALILGVFLGLIADVSN